MKFLALIFGINAANSDYPCVWCPCKIKNQLDHEKIWNISDRNLEDAEKLCNEKTVNSRKGYINKPLFYYIKFEDCIIDILHLYLRITDKLFEKLLNKIYILDSFSSTTTNLDSRKNFKIFWDFIENECRITNPFYPSVKTINKYKIRSLNCIERDKILVNLKKQKISNIFPNLDINDANCLDFIFSTFYNIIKQIRENKINKENVEKFKSDLKIWMHFYVKIEPTVSHEITPYIHVFVFHLPEFILKHGHVNLYNMQGLEKLNDLLTKIYHFASNKHKKNKSYLLQMINKRNRMEFFLLNGQETQLI